MGDDQPAQGFRRLETLLDTIKKQGKFLCDFLLSLHLHSLLIVNRRSLQTNNSHVMPSLSLVCYWVCKFFFLDHQNCQQDDT